MSVGAVVVTYQRLDVLVNTLHAIRSQSVRPHSIIVVDNDADDQLQAWLTKSMPDVAYTALPENAGFSAALSCGMRWLHDRHDPDWFWLLDDDSPPSTRYLSDALAIAQQEPRPWVIANRGGRMVRGRLRYGFDSNEQTHRAGFTLLDGTLIARAAVEVAGYPREDLFMMFEDIEYTTRIAELGGILIVNRSDVNAMYLGSGASWRAYYLARNHLRVALDRRSPVWLWSWLYRMVALSVFDVRKGRWGALRLRWKGAIDGARGHMGRTI